MEKLVLIQLKDICYYGDDFEYEPFLVVKDENFSKKYQKLKRICQSYESFDEVEDFITENFEKIEFEKRIIEV